MQPTVLLVDDDDLFKGLVEIVFKKTASRVSFQHVWDGEEAISYLSRQGRFADATSFPTPSLVLLDLKMPRLDGFEVLQWKSGNPELKSMPFVVLSSSDLAKDKRRASELGAQEYLTKPMNLNELRAMITTLDRFWPP